MLLGESFLILPCMNPHNLPENIKIAFFDLDETITSRETDNLWARWRSRFSPRGLMDLIRLQRINRLYYSHSLEPEDYKLYHLSRARTMSPERYRRLADRFASYTVKRFVYGEMLGILENNRSRGIRNVLITAQDEVLAAAFHRLLNTDGCLASRYITGKRGFEDMKTPLCFREGKIYWAGQYLREQGIPWKDTAFYTDSLNDLPLLEVCGYPVAVHPSREFAELCRSRSWPVLTPV